MITATLALGLLVSSGTLVAMAPSAGGLVVAADRATSVGGRVCDAPKLVEVARPEPTVVAVPGLARITVGAAGVDPCRAERAAERVLDLEAVARAHVERHGAPRTEADTAGLGRAVLDALAAARRAHPDVARFLAARAGRPLCQLAVATWDAGRAEARIGLANVAVGPDGAPRVTEAHAWVLGPERRRTVVVLGQWDYVSAHVLTRGRHLVTEYLRFMQADRTIAQTSRDEAVAALVDLIEGAARLTASVPAEHPIGGPVDVLLLGGAARPVRLRWASP